MDEDAHHAEVVAVAVRAGDGEDVAVVFVWVVGLEVLDGCSY